MKKRLRLIKKILVPVKYAINALVFGIKALYFSRVFDRQSVICCMGNPAVVGGTELQFELISKGLKERGLLKIAMTHGVIQGNKSNPLPFKLKQHQIAHLHGTLLTRFNCMEYSVLRAYLSQVFRRFQTPIFHIFNPSCAPLIPAAKEAGMRVVFTETGLPIKTNEWWAPLIPYIDDLDHVISVSEAGLSHLRSQLEYKGPGTIIHSSIEAIPSKYQCRLPKEGVFDLIYFGRIDQGKGIDVLLRAFVQVISACPYATLTLIGKGGLFDSMNSLAKELRLENKVTFLGYLDRDQMLEKITQADLFCLPSMFEGCPCSILEAMALGLPVIATNVGGIPELVIHEHTGLLIPPNDIDALVHAIHRLAADSDLRVKMGENGLLRYREKFAQNSAFEKLLTIYQTLLSNRV